mgnify:CR=1 FL=1
MPALFGEGHPTGDDGNYLWTEAATGLTVLLIGDQLRNEMLNAGSDEILKGQRGLLVASAADARRTVPQAGPEQDLRLRRRSRPCLRRRLV